MFRRILPRVPRTSRIPRIPLLLVALAAMLAGCEKTDHESIDKWSRTEKGPGKLKKAVSDEDLDPDLSAHAAVNLIKPPLQQESEIREILEKMSPGRRAQVLEKLVPRLWDAARLENEKKLPSAVHVAAKDALVTVRQWADERLRQQIDTYLIDWYAVTSYEGRANAGQYPGATVVRLIGPPFARRLIDVLNGLIAAPGQDKEKFRLGRELLLAIAATGSPDGVKKLLEVASMDRGDPNLTTRVFDVLYVAYIDPAGLFDIQTPDALASNIDALAAYAKDDSQPGRVVNTAIELIRAVGEPACFEPLVGMVPVPHRTSRFKYVTANNALRCGGTKSIAQVVRALPEGAYIREELTGAIAGEIAKMSPREQVLTQLRELLGEKSTVARWTAIEALAMMKSAEDRPRVSALSGAKDRLIGYWGEEGEGKPDPTLGQRAKELAEQLGK
jgi:HEAT repeat protein